MVRILEELFQDGIADAVLGSCEAVDAYKEQLIWLVQHKSDLEDLDVEGADLSAAREFLSNWRRAIVQEATKAGV